MRIAIFDVCDTLYSTNTTFTFLDTYIDSKSYKLFRIFSKTFFGKVINYVFYKYFKNDIVRTIATKYLSNKTEIELQTLAEDFIVNHLMKYENKNIINMLEQYKSNDYKIIFMSGAYDFIIKEVATYFKVDTFYATKLELKDSKYTGRLSHDILLKKDELFKKDYKDFDHLVVVSDNKTDLSLLNIANESFAICNKEKDLYFWEKYPKIKIIRNFI